MSASTSSMPASSDLHPDIMVQYLKSLGVTPETTRAIREEVMAHYCGMCTAPVFCVLHWLVRCGQLVDVC